jgi:hypothetical protein
MSQNFTVAATLFVFCKYSVMHFERDINLRNSVASALATKQYDNISLGDICVIVQNVNCIAKASTGLRKRWNNHIDYLCKRAITPLTEITYDDYKVLSAIFLIVKMSLNIDDRMIIGIEAEYCDELSSSSSSSGNKRYNEFPPQ